MTAHGTSAALNRQPGQVSYGVAFFIAAVLAVVAMIAFYAVRPAEHAEETALAEQQRTEIATAQSAAHARQFCGSMGEPDCVCQGGGSVTRYLEPGESVLVRVDGKLAFKGSLWRQGLKLCDPDDPDKCVTESDQNLRSYPEVKATNTGEQHMKLVCGPTDR